MSARGSGFKAAIAVVLAVFAVPFLAGCQSVRFMADYDEKTVSMIEGLHRQTSAVIFKMRDGASYEACREQYLQIDLELSALRVHVGAFEKNTETIYQVENLSKKLDETRDLHQKKGTLSKGYANTQKGTLERDFKNLLKLEFAKRRRAF